MNITFDPLKNHNPWVKILPNEKQELHCICGWIRRHGVTNEAEIIEHQDSVDEDNMRWLWWVAHIAKMYPEIEVEYSD